MDNHGRVHKKLGVVFVVSAEGVVVVLELGMVFVDDFVGEGLGVHVLVV